MGSITKHFDQSYSQNMSNQNTLLATATILLFVVSSHTFKISARDYCPPKPKTMNPFDTSKFLGDWYQVSGLPAFFQPGDYWLLDTDYENFASVYACTDVLGLLKIEFAWILVRDPYAVSFDTMNQALSAFKAQNLTTANFLPVSNE